MSLFKDRRYLKGKSWADVLKPSPKKYRQALEYLKERGVLQNISGLLVGKPMDEMYSEEYKELLMIVTLKQVARCCLSVTTSRE